MESCLVSVVNEFEAILEASKANLAKVYAKNESSKWWKIRIDLDDRLKNMLLYMENVMLSDAIVQILGNTMENTVLILDKVIQRLPWENIPCLRNKSVSRMPSILFLSHHLSTIKPFVNIQKVTFIVNPSGELTKTQQIFEPYFKEKKWIGMTTVPSPEQYKQALENHDVFIYMGHGSGEQYMRSTEIPTLKKCATALLMGCSSGELIDNGEYDPDGPVLNYILGGCPCVVSNLWDVTDVDIDKFAMEVLESWGGENSLTKSVKNARDKCKLRYLNGCAPVCYGIPVFVEKIQK
jgi:separase